MTEQFFESSGTDNANQGDSDQQTENTGATQAQRDNQFFEELVGEGKKFKDAEALARGKAESDSYIKHLEEQLKELRDEFGKTSNLVKNVEQLKAQLTNQQAGQREHSGENTAPELDEAKIAEMVKSQMSAIEKQRTAEDNVRQAKQEALSFFGTADRANEALTAKANELGVSVQFLSDTAQQSPTAFLNLLGVQQSREASGTKNAAPRDASVNTDMAKYMQGAGQPRSGTKEYFENIRKADKHRYWSSAVQTELFKAKKAGTYQ